MAEFNISRFKYVWRGVWQSGVTFSQDDIVANGGKIYVCLIGHVGDLSTFDNDLNAVDQYGNAQPRWELMADGQKWRGDWAANTKYEQEEIVKYGATLYKCSEGHTSAANVNLGLENDNDKWDFLARAYQWRNDWITNRKYLIGDLVKYNGNVYLCNTTHIAAATNELGLEDALSNWTIVNRSDHWLAEWATNTRYKERDVVKFGGNIYRCVTGHTSSLEQLQGLLANSDNWELVSENVKYRGNWTANTLYVPNDVVKYGSSLQRATTISASATFPIGEFELYFPGTGYEAVWLAATVYTQGDMVIYGGYTYRSTSNNNQGAVPATSPSSWQLVTTGYNFLGDWTDQLYKTGDVVREGGEVYIATQDTASYPDESPRTDTYTFTVQEVDGANKYFVNNIVTPNLYFVENNTYVINQDDASNEDHPIYISTVPNGHHGSGYNYLTNVEYILDGTAVTPENYNTNFATALQRRITLTIDENFPRNFYIVCHNHAGMYNSNNITRTENSASWEKIITGRAWKGNWDEETYYKLGDVVTYAGTAYTCIQAHNSDLSSLTEPKLDTTNQYWEVLVQGSPTNVQYARGDIKTRESGVDKKLEIGPEGYSLAVNDFDLVSWKNQGQVDNVFYVSTSGTDLETSGTIGKPFRTIKFACDRISADPGLRPATIFVLTGTYAEQLPISIPKDTALVGDELRSVQVKPALGYETSNMFYVNNGAGIRNMTLLGLSGTLGPANEYFTQRPTAGAYVSLDPGTGTDDSDVWITTKSPYIQNVTTFGTGCIGLKVDGDLHDGGYRSVVANDFTQILSDGIGYWANGEGRSELVSVFTYYCHIGYLATGGGKVRATNGNNSYGDYGSVAEGTNTQESAISAELDNRTKEAQVSEVFFNGSGNIVGLGYSHAGEQYTTATASITGSGIGGNLQLGKSRKNAIGELRLIAADDSSIIGGAEFRNIENNAQGGSTTNIVISQSDEAQTDTYTGMNIFIKTGLGAGQWATISAYNPSTKTATVQNRYGQSGWNHIKPGTAIEPILDGTTRYVIEPNIVVSEPTYEVDNQLTGSFKSVGAVASSDDTIVLVPTGSNIGAYSTDASTYTNFTLPASDDWNNVIWTGTKFIAFGENVNIADSTDGQGWQELTINTGNANEIRDVEKFGSTIMIATDDEVIVSTDSGVTWTPISIGKLGGFNFVAYDSGRWIVVDTAGECYESTDQGGTWSALPSTLISSAGLSNYSITSVAGGSGAFVAMARDDLGINACRVIQSANSQNESLNFALGAVLRPNPNDLTEISVGNWKVTHGGGLFFAISNNGQFNSSQDAINWKSHLPIGGNTVQKVDYVEFGNTFQAYYLCNSNSASSIAAVKYGATCVARAKVVARRVNQLQILDPGSGYGELDNITVTANDPNAVTDITVQVRKFNGVLPQLDIFNSGSFYTRADITIDGDGFADIYPVAGIIQVKNLLRLPGPGDALTFQSLAFSQFNVQKITNVNGTEPNLTAQIQIDPPLSVNEAPLHEDVVEIRQKYSQIRLTGHDFLDIGTGNFSETAYPLRYTEGYSSDNEPLQFRETVGSGGGRVFYTSTDQDGNFRVGELFKVEQATGIVTISASQFDLSGLDELRLGGIILGGTNAVVREFSTDPTFVDNSDNVVPTQKAIAAYVASRISSGGSNVNANVLIAGEVTISAHTAELTGGALASNIDVTAPANIKGGHSGLYLLQQLFTAP